MPGAPLPAVTDLAGMAEILMVEASSLAKVWRAWPHFFVGSGRTARGARFRPEDVLEYLEQHNGNYFIHDQERQAVSVEVYKEGARVAAKAGFASQQDAKKWEARVLTRAERQEPTGTDFLQLATDILMT